MSFWPCFKEEAHSLAGESLALGTFPEQPLAFALAVPPPSLRLGLLSRQRLEQALTPGKAGGISGKRKKNTPPQPRSPSPAQGGILGSMEVPGPLAPTHPGNQGLQGRQFRVSSWLPPTLPHAAPSIRANPFITPHSIWQECGRLIKVKPTNLEASQPALRLRQIPGLLPPPCPPPPLGS